MKGATCGMAVQCLAVEEEEAFVSRKSELNSLGLGESVSLENKAWSKEDWPSPDLLFLRAWTALGSL